MLTAKGGTGFPTLMFLDPEGRSILDFSGPRTVKGFEEGLVEVQEFLDLAKKAEAGDAKAATELFLRQMRREWFDFEEAKARSAALTKVSAKQQEEIDRLLVDAEVRTVAARAGKDPEQRRGAGEHFLAMWKDKRLPSAAAQLYSFWSMLADYAEHAKDKALFKKVVGEFKEALGSDPRYRPSLQKLEERLENFPKK